MTVYGARLGRREEGEGTNVAVGISINFAEAPSSII